MATKGPSSLGNLTVDCFQHTINLLKSRREISRKEDIFNLFECLKQCQLFHDLRFYRNLEQKIFLILNQMSYQHCKKGEIIQLDQSNHFIYFILQGDSIVLTPTNAIDKYEWNLFLSKVQKKIVANESLHIEQDLCSQLQIEDWQKNYQKLSRGSNFGEYNILFRAKTKPFSSMLVLDDLHMMKIKNEKFLAVFDEAIQNI